MITCNRCGSLSPISAMNCQNCGAPLSSNADAGLAQPRGFQDQPELPAWLGSLRAGERPAAPADNPSNFSTADLIEEGSLPSWMRSVRPEMNDTGLSSPHLSLRPASASGPNTDDSKGINAQSLIDEKSLPSWMQENKPQPSGPIPAGGIGASSLVQQDMMPDWMKSLQQNSPLSGPVQPKSQPAPTFPAPPAASPMAASPNEISARPAQGFSARDLVDQQSLPAWMQLQESKGAPPVQPGAGGNLSLSSLVDADSLPPWLREGAAQEQRSGGLPPPQVNAPWQSVQPPMQGGGAMPQSPFGQSVPAPMPPQSAPAWQTASPQMPATPGINSGPVQGGGLSASSFIDPNALPQWLRSGNEQQNQPGGAMPLPPPASTPRGGYSVPPRVDNVRVPSRPRGEMNPNENNEAAANVFASMLGVASSAPNFPGSPPAQSYGGMQGGSFGQGVAPAPQMGASPVGNMAGQSGGANPGFNNPQGPQAQGYMPGGGSYPPVNPGQGNYPAGNYPAGNYPAGNSFPGASQYSAGNPGMSGGTGNLGMDMGADPKNARKPAKKGIFDVIRDWFR